MALPLLLCGIVLLWIGGFDIIYSLQDAEFDRKNGLRSIPAKLGGARALMVSRTFHLLMVGLLLLLGVTAHMGALYFVGAGITAALIIYEQSIVSATDLSRVNLAFFTLNGWVSVSLFIFTALDVATR
ncbi:MAG: UbiA family prenyltransferase, partial [Chthonomonadales bacterium]